MPPLAWTAIVLLCGYALSFAPGLDRLRFDGGFWPGIAVVGLGVLVIALAAAQFRRANTQLMPNSESNNALVANGVFAVTRNPMYLGMVLYCLGAAIMAGRIPMLVSPALMFAVANWVFIPFEEAKMRRQFGAGFDDYTMRVRRWL